MNITCSYLAELNLFENWHPLELHLFQFAGNVGKSHLGLSTCTMCPQWSLIGFTRDTRSLIWQFYLLNYFTCPLFAASEWEDSYSSVNVSPPPLVFLFLSVFDLKYEPIGN